MAIKKVRATQVTCDGCGAVQIVTDMLDIIGFNGIVSEQHEGGGTGSVKFFACTAVCLQAAVQNTIERSYK